MLLNMAIEIVDFPIKNGGSFHSYVSFPEGMSRVVIPGSAARALSDVVLLFSPSLELLALTLTGVEHLW
jgi:aspartate 1-decarboxylase